MATQREGGGAMGAIFPGQPGKGGSHICQIKTIHNLSINDFAIFEISDFKISERSMPLEPTNILFHYKMKRQNFQTQILPWASNASGRAYSVAQYKLSTDS